MPVFNAGHYHREFPDYPESDMPEIPDGFTDTSWHNDMCPSFSCLALGLIIYVDYASVEQREFGIDSSRFVVQTLDTEGCLNGKQPICATDDWSDVLDCIIAKTKALIAAESLGACNQAKLDTLNRTIELLFQQRG